MTPGIDHKGDILPPELHRGSNLGPDLRNVSYHGIMRTEMPEDIFLIGYAGDIAAVVLVRMEGAHIRLNQAMRRVKSWLEENGLDLATEKTEIVLVTAKKNSHYVANAGGHKGDRNENRCQVQRSK